jgi:hypothetical protein
MSPSRPGLKVWSMKFVGLDICRRPNGLEIKFWPNSIPKASSCDEGGFLTLITRAMTLFNVLLSTISIVISPRKSPIVNYS